jgi:signal transduction histidine kinase
MSDFLLTGTLVSARFSLAWYSGRLFSVITATAVLAVLLAQTTRLYGRLAHSNLELQRERTNKLMNLEAMVASISHELAQPLGAIVANGRAALNFSRQAPPNLDEVQQALDEVISDGHRAHKVLDGIRSLFGTANQVQEPVNMNEIIVETLHVLRRELKEHDVTAHTELFSDLPGVMGHKGQLQEVILNLVNNAMEAMDTVKNRERLLGLKTQRDGRNAILVAVQDTGPGIDREKLSAVFDAFVTTKPRGMGLGLAICRMIVQRHGGTLSAQSGETGGALFQFTLPVNSVSGPAL